MRKHVQQATQDSSWTVPGKYKNENGEKSNLKNAILGTAKLGAANFQTGGGAKSALALNWIDLERVWHCKSYSWHTAEFKNVCKYGVGMHIEGSTSLWRKKYPSGGLRSSNWLWSQLENLTRIQRPEGLMAAKTLVLSNSHIFIHVKLQWPMSTVVYLYFCFFLWFLSPKRHNIEFIAH